MNRDVSKAYEITKDEESRTDLYVSKSSLEAVSDPSGTLKAWKEKIENYSDSIELAFEDVLSLINGPVMAVDQVWKEVQAQRVSLDEISASSRSKLGDELALDLAKVLVRNGKSLGDIDKLSDDDIAIIQNFAQKFIEFGSGQISCGGADECGPEAQGDFDDLHYRDKDLNNKAVEFTALKLDTAGRKMLEQSARLQSHLESLPTEQAQLLVLGIQAVMGPAKVAVGLAGNVLVDKLFGEKLTEIKDSLAKKLASELSGEDRARLERSDKLYKELYELSASDQKGDVYVRGATTLLNIALGTAVNSMGAVGGKVIGKGANADSSSDGLKVDLDQKFGENPPKGWVDTAPAPKPTSTLPDSYHDVKVSDTGGLPEGGQRVISLAGAEGEVSGLLPKPGATSNPASGVGAGATFKVDSKQLGKKFGKHVEDFGGNAASPADRKMVLDKIHDVGSNPEKVILGTFAGQGANGARGDVFFRVKGNDVVVTKPDGTFVTILKDGVTQNPSVQSALKGGVR
ncbi:hypothetical protein PSCICN_48050 [Pseudomonas cichorii]|nr:hypothetical protein PSCICN_48050 [Pseudomonas cichorii]